MREGWRIRKLGDLADLQRGLTYSKGDEVPFSSKRVLRSNNIDLESSKLDLTELKYLRDDFAIPDDRKVKKNSIFICMSNGSKQHVGKVAFIDTDIDYAFGGFMGLIVPKAGIAPKYVFYSCQSSAYRLFLSSIGNGIGITNLRFTDLANYSLPVPPIAEQEKIVSELDCLTSIIEKKKQQLEELDKLAQSIFYDMFGDPNVNDKHWRTVKFSETCKNLDYMRRPITAKDRVAGSIPYYGASGIVDWVKDFIFDGDFLLISEDGANLLMRHTPIAFPAKGKTWVNNHAHILQFEHLYEQCFMEHFINLMDISSLITGAAQPKLTQANLNSIDVFDIQVSSKVEFVKKIKAVEKQKELVKRSIVETETLFNSRMDFWFNN